MTKRAAVFLAVTSSIVAGYLAFAAATLKESATTPADDALVRGIWVACGAVVVVCLCATFEAVSERLNPDRHHSDSA